jgi:hypothetical protein
MAQINENNLKDFVLNFESKVVTPLVSAGFERNKYNIFDILNINRQELRHSDFLAFLMNPSQSGDVGQQFLRNFIAMLSKENSELGLDFFKVFYSDFDKVVVKREYKNIDILVDIEISGKKFLVVIENKIDSGEQMYDDKEIKGQLVKYQTLVNTEYKNHKPIFLFLSPNKRPPSENEWIPIDYNFVCSVLGRVNTDKTDNTIKTLINDYKKMIRSEFEMANDTELREAALRIYNADKDVFDFIFNNRPNRVNTTAKIIKEYLSKLNWAIPHSERQIAYISFTTVKHIYFDKQDFNFAVNF